VGDAKTDRVSKILWKHKGIRIPGSWDSFETAVGVIVGQFVSVSHAKQKMAKIVELFGSPLFPTPEVLAQADLKKIGMTKVKEHAIRELSRKISTGEIQLSRTVDILETKKKLLEIKGIGSWTAEMIAMKCLGDTNAFPKNDLVIQRLLKNSKAVKQDWSPWNAYVTVALWKESQYQ
jgi:AraC family transcriptional regulator of adaptative response / DNA-3-methyladenine glycosylase II